MNFLNAGAKPDLLSILAQNLSARFRAEFPSAQIESLRSVLLDYTEDHDLIYLQRLIQPQQHWHLIRYYDDRLTEHLDAFGSAPSMDVALAEVLHQCGEYRVLPLSSDVSRDLVEIVGHRGRIATIKPIIFDVADPSLMQRTASALQGIQRLYDFDRAAFRLNRIPGLQRLKGRHYEISARGGALLSTAANIAKAIQSALDCVAINAKLSTCQELLAKTAGAANWSHLRAVEIERDCMFRPYYLEFIANSGHDGAHQIYRSASEGLAGLAQLIQRGSVEDVELDFFSHTTGGVFIVPRESDSRGPCLETVPEINNEDLDVSVARELLRGSLNIAELYRARGTYVERVNVGSSMSPERALDRLQIGNHLFSRAVYAEKEHLVLELLDPNAEAVEKRTLALYKAELVATGDGEIQIFEDYQRYLWLDLSGWTTTDVMRLAGFMKFGFREAAEALMNSGSQS